MWNRKYGIKFIIKYFSRYYADCTQKDNNNTISESCLYNKIEINSFIFIILNGEMDHDQISRGNNLF